MKRLASKKADWIAWKTKEIMRLHGMPKVTARIEAITELNKRLNSMPTHKALEKC